MKEKDIILKTNDISVNFDGFYALTDVNIACLIHDFLS